MMGRKQVWFFWCFFFFFLSLREGGMGGQVSHFRREDRNDNMEGKSI